MSAAHPLGRRAAIALAFVPVAAAVAVAAVPWHGPAPAVDRACIDYTVPLHPGYEEEIRAIIARGDEPGRIGGGGSGYPDYFRNATRATHFYTDTKSVAYRLPPVPEYVDSRTAPMAVATALNLYAAPPGPCVWEHEYIAWGGSLEDLEYDRRLRCYLADEPAGAPVPYELADEETRALVDRAGPAPGHAGGDIRYLERNTRAGMLAGADFGSPDRTIRDALEHTGGNAYRAAKMINRESPAGAGCVMEYIWIAGGGSLSSLEYSDARRCYLAPDGAASGDSGAHCLGRWHP